MKSTTERTRRRVGTRQCRPAELSKNLSVEEVLEEIRQLRAATAIYRELVMRLLDESAA